MKIAKDLDLPDEAITQTFAILAKRGVGKTYTASVLAEEMLKKNLPVVVLDPIGVWWGLRSSADGKSAGLSIIIAGGDHADIPITPENGTVMANLIIDEKLSVVIDLSLFRKGEQVKFVTDFAETLYHRNRTALHLIVDEADAFAPQRVAPNEARMLGAMEDLVRRGRARGIGMTMITQRPAVLNKNVLTQIEVLVALRLIAPQDRKAIDEWIKIHATEEQRAEFMQSLPQLDIGEAWFWSPGWLDIFQRIKVRKRETLDSSSTPKAGESKVEARKMAEVDLGKLRDQLSETITKLESQDPRALKRRINQLEIELANAKKHPVIEIQKVPIVTDKVIADLQRLFDNFKSQPILKVLQDIQVTLNDISSVDITSSAPIPVEIPDKNGEWKPTTSIDISLSKYARSLLETLRDRHPMKLTRGQISTLSGRKPRSSAFSGAMAEITKSGLVEKVGDQFELTDAGHSIVGTVGRVPDSPEETRRVWLNALPAYESDLLRALIEVYPKAIPRHELSERTGRSITSSAFHSSLSSLSRNGLAENTHGEVRASDNLFIET